MLIGSTLCCVQEEMPWWYWGSDYPTEQRHRLKRRQLRLSESCFLLAARENLPCQIFVCVLRQVDCPYFYWPTLLHHSERSPGWHVSWNAIHMPNIRIMIRPGCLARNFKQQGPILFKARLSLGLKFDRDHMRCGS